MDAYEEYRYHQAKRWLDHVAGLRHAVEASREMMERFEGLASSARSFGCPQDKVSSSPNTKQLEDAVVKLEAARAQWEADFSRYADEAADAARRIGKLEDGTERRALLLHYVSACTWESACAQMGYSWQRMMEIRKSGVLNMYEHMPLEWRDPMEPAV